MLRHKKKLEISSKLAGTTMCKSLRASVDSEESRLGLDVYFRTVYFARDGPEDEQSILFSCLLMKTSRVYCSKRQDPIGSFQSQHSP